MIEKAGMDDSEARRAWETNAAFWDERMGEGNEFFRVLIWPAMERLLALTAGARILDVACGNGVSSRRLAAAGARVVAVDFSAPLIDLARTRPHADAIDYKVVDVTRYDALVALGGVPFDGAICSMAFMDIEDLRPLMTALAELLRPGAPLVLATTHPCFNSPGAVQLVEAEDRAGELTTTYSVKTSQYKTAYTRLGTGMRGQPVPHPYFHRSLGALLAPGLEAGFVVDALEERAFPPDHSGGSSPLSWSGRFSEIPPVLVVRMRRRAA